MKIISCVILFVSIFAMQNEVKAESFVDELKIGIYAKDYKKIYGNLSLQLSKDQNNTNPDKWIEVGDMLVEIKDYQSAWQFFFHAAISLFQNETYSKREKIDKFSQIIEKSEAILKAANPIERLKLEKSKFSQYPGEINIISTLSRMLEKSESNVVVTIPERVVIDNQEMSATIDLFMEDRGISQSIENKQLEVVHNIQDEAPYYDYNELLANLTYPQRAYGEGLEGKVVVEVVVDEKGNVVGKSVRTSTHQIFNDFALKAIDSVSFIAGKRMGVPVMMKILIPVHFRIN